MSTVRLDRVWFGYPGVPVLEDVSLTVRPGERVALLGRNGAGKTTLTKLLVALLHPDRGTVWLGDRATRGLAPEDLAGQVAYVFQHPDQQLFARTALDEVAFGPAQQGVPREEARDRAVAALRRVGLERFAAVHPYDLAPAQRKLLTLASALAQGPRLLVLDEPVQGLDRRGTALVVEIVHELSADGVAVLAVTHDLGVVVEALDRAVVLARRTVAHDGAAETLVRDPARVAALGLELPPAARLSVALALPGRPVRVQAVADALRGRCRDG